VYRGVIEHSVYVHPSAQGQGIEAALLEALIGSTEAAGIWTIQTGIFPENTISLRLHERVGSALLAPASAWAANGVWRQVTFLERRSAVTGT
jgi:L-amino acid N-acyltransferase YncA